MRSTPGGPPGRHDPHGPRVEAIPKPGGGVRWFTRLDPAGEAEFRAAVGPLAGRIERSLGPEVLASRTRPSADGSWLAPWRPARRAWRRTLRVVLRDASPGTAFAVADVRDCYGSITPDIVEELLGPEAAHAVSLLRGFQERGVRGLPVGPEPSAVLANAVLARLDIALREAGIGHRRWVDDFVLWGPRSDVRRALSMLVRSAAALGLDLHDRKTGLASREEVRLLALGGRHSSIIAAP